jgi:hypothetical protein
MFWNHKYVSVCNSYRYDLYHGASTNYATARKILIFFGIPFYLQTEQVHLNLGSLPYTQNPYFNINIDIKIDYKKSVSARTGFEWLKTWSIGGILCIR